MSRMIKAILEWYEIKVRPNSIRRYFLCPVCECSWWRGEEGHSDTCWVPMLQGERVKELIKRSSDGEASDDTLD
jgi:hypothetical protein